MATNPTPQSSPTKRPLEKGGSSDSPQAKAHVAFKANEAIDLSANFTQLVAQLNTEWAAMTSRVKAVEDRHGSFELQCVNLEKRLENRMEELI